MKSSHERIFFNLFMFVCRGKVVVPHRIANPWLLFSWIYRLTETANEELDQKKRLDEFTRRMIKRRREAMENGEKTERKSLLDYMLEISESNPDFTEQDIVNEVCTFMLAVRAFKFAWWFGFSPGLFTCDRVKTRSVLQRHSPFLC